MQKIIHLFLLLSAISLAHGQSAPSSGEPTGSTAASSSDLLAEKIQAELSGEIPVSIDAKVDRGVPRGLFLHGAITDSKIYPGTENGFIVYVPAQYDPAKPACLLVQLDGFGGWEGAVLDKLIAKKEVPIMIGVGIVPGTIGKDPPGTPRRAAIRFNRSYEFDSMNSDFPDYVVNELLPEVQKMRTPDGRIIRISSDRNDRAVTGGSSGAIGAFTLAWQRPDQFSRIYDYIGTFVSMRGGHEYPALIRKTEPKPLRIFLEDGSADAWNPLFGSWFEANLSMDSALRFAGYDVAHAWGTHGHNPRPAMAIFPDVMRWLWRDYPGPIKAGISQNSTLREITDTGEGWQNIGQNFQSAAGLAADARGEVYVSDAAGSAIYRLGQTGNTISVFARRAGVVGEAFGPDGLLYGLVPGERKIIALTPGGNSRTIAEGIAGRGIIATHTGALYVSEPGEHSDMPSRIWQITTAGGKRLVDEGLSAASGVAFSPDGSLFAAAECDDKWVYSYVVEPDGSLADKQRFYWLHVTDVPDNSGAEDIAFDRRGNLYVATRMGVQICDQNGRVRAILPLPQPSGPVRSLCFGGEHFDVLYVTDGKQIFRRRVKVPGIAPWARPITVRSQGAG